MAFEYYLEKNGFHIHSNVVNILYFIDSIEQRFLSGIPKRIIRIKSFIEVMNKRLLCIMFSTSFTYNICIENLITISCRKKKTMTWTDWWFSEFIWNPNDFYGSRNKTRMKTLVMWSVDLCRQSTGFFSILFYSSIVPIDLKWLKFKNIRSKSSRLTNLGNFLTWDWFDLQNRLFAISMSDDVIHMNKQNKTNIYLNCWIELYFSASSLATNSNNGNFCPVLFMPNMKISSLYRFLSLKPYFAE